MTYQGNEIRLGQIIGTDRELVMSAEDRQTHMYIPGNTGVGKSKLMESMICQDIDAWMESGCGLLLIDPHGPVYRNVLKYVAESGIDRPIIPLDFCRDDWILGYNLLHQRQGADPSVIVDELVDAISHIFGQRDSQGTPTFARVATSVLLTLLLQGRPFLEASQLASSKTAMKLLASLVPEYFTRIDLEQTAGMADKEFLAEIRSTMNRLRPFSQNQRFKAIFGHIGETLDLRQVLNDGSILLVNLETRRNRLSLRQARLFGTLLLTDLWAAVRDRGKPDDAADIKPFYVYIDECQNFVTPTIAENLVEARGYGLNLILANQYPSKFLDAGENGAAMYRAVMAAARSKTVFQMTEQNDLPTLTKELFYGLLDPLKVKQWTTKVVGYEIRETKSQTTSTSDQKGKTQSHRTRGGTGQRTDELDEPDIFSQEISEHGAIGRSFVEGHNQSETVGEMLVPILGEEVGQYFSLDEQLAMFEKIVNAQDKREGMVRLQSMKTPVAIRTHDVSPPWVSNEDLDAYIQKRLRSLPYAVPLAEAFETATMREREFLNTVTELTGTDEPRSAARTVQAKVRKLKPRAKQLGLADSLQQGKTT
jgi:hypothetical protein